MKIALPKQVETLIERLQQSGFEAYAVGGCVRDSLLGKTPKDWDVTTSATPEQVSGLFAAERVVETGMKHGTVTVLIDSLPIEVTTFRVESSYGDHRHPDSVRFTLDLKEDLARRDFTVNAMAYNPNRGLIDFFDGQLDLARRRLRCVGDPNKRFAEDALRIIRALRFSSVLEFPIEDKTAQAIRRHREDLLYVAHERISSELMKLLGGNAVGTVLRQYADVLFTVLPELKPMYGFEQHSRYHAYDVYEHTVRSVEAITPCPLLRFTMLFHDSGKPNTFTQDADGTGHFYGHDTESVALVKKAMERLRVSRAFFDRVVLLITHHDLRFEQTDAMLKRWLGRLGEEAMRQLLAVQAADCAAQAPSLIYRLENLVELEKRLNRLVEQEACFTLKQLNVNGNDLIELGIPEGSAVGECLQFLLDAVIEGSCGNEKTALLKQAASFKEKRF